MAQRHTLRIVAARYKNAGVPKRAWQIATRALDTFFSSRQEKDDWWWSYAKHLRHPDLITTKVRPTAFFILKKFYEKGVSTRYINWRRVRRVRRQEQGARCRAGSGFQVVALVRGPLRAREA